ncbi:hypothetical protein SAMN02745165_00249 [Malonomonas rubra DSM 5091]|uniref:Uncharacterized protein n=1 Tax=Malonomonas rubra DSM 5091 TaxID=1122189 RepID=A0A1M6BNT0_MALRU|nr:hypothetical protein [Malonomonas rubra]SHI50389.1 hypothetical protein SAMN02745165_00249 [Malonomonas rubra DSM 5091]
MQNDEKKSTKLFRTAGSALNNISFRTNQYKQVVQKKIDLEALQKRIDQLHIELGKVVAEQYHAGQRDLLASKEVSRLLEKSTSLRRSAELLKEEIELIKNEKTP